MLPKQCSNRSAIAARIGLATAGLALGLLVAGASQAGSRTIRWTHPDPGAIWGFQVSIGSASGVYDRVLSVGKPGPDSSGIFSVMVDLGGDSPAYVAVRAIGNDGVPSSLSNERAWYQSEPLGQPGTPFVVGP